MDQTNKISVLPIISGLFVGILVLSNILASKVVALGPFVFDGGTLLFPLSYIFGDILVEVYGFKASRKVIWTGFAMLLLMGLNIAIVGWLPPDPSWPLQEAFLSILMPVPRIILGSIVAYFVGEYVNSVVLSKMKLLTKGRWLWTRTVGSTVVGQAVDTLVFVVIAFAGLVPLGVLAMMILSNYLFKVAIEVLFTPITYKVVSLVKRIEKKDVFDEHVSYNPFGLSD